MWLWVCILRLGQKHQVSSFAKVMMFSRNGAHGSSLAPSEAIFKELSDSFNVRDSNESGNARFLRRRALFIILCPLT
jgi:hypothetical protein